MDPMFLSYQNPYDQVPRHNFNGFVPNSHPSPKFIKPRDETKVPMNVTHPFPTGFTQLNLNGFSPQQKEAAISGYFSPVPFLTNAGNDDQNVKQEYIPSPYARLKETAVAKSTPSYRRNLFPLESNGVDGNDVPVKSTSPYVNVSVPPEFVPRNSLPTADIVPSVNTQFTTPEFIPSTFPTCKESSILKYQDLSVVPEFIPKSVQKKLKNEQLVTSPISNNSLTPSSLHDLDSTSSTEGSNLTTYQENVNGTVYFYTGPVAGTSMTPPAEATPDLSNVSTSSSPTNLYSNPVKFDSPLDMQFKQMTISMPDATAGVPYYINNGLTGNMFGKPTLMDPTSAVFQPIPEKIENYCNLIQLEPLPRVPSSTMPAYVTTMYKAIHTKSNIPYCLRRIHDVSLPSTKCLSMANMWMKLSHSNLVQLNDLFVTTEFGDSSLVFVYDFYEDCETVLSKHFASQIDGVNGYTDTFSSDPNAPRPYSHTKNALLRQQHSNVMLAESVIWSYVIQLTGALRIIHSAGLACRCMDPTKIIFTGTNNRLRISGIGINDIVMYNHSVTNRLTMTSHFQQEDLTALGKLLLAMTCGSLIANQKENVQTSLELMSRSYSKDIRNLITYLLSSNQKRNVVDLMPMIGARFYSHIDAMQLQCDIFQHELLKQTNSKHLLKLLIKLSVINDHSNLTSDDSPETTNDKYAISLFRDYLYEQVTDDQRLLVNTSHVIGCLTKLDYASVEKVCLIPKNDNPAMIMSYEDIKECLERLFNQFSYYAVYTDEDVGIPSTA